MSVSVSAAKRYICQYRSIFVVHNEYQKESAILRQPGKHGSWGWLSGRRVGLENLLSDLEGCRTVEGVKHVCKGPRPHRRFAYDPPIRSISLFMDGSPL